MADFSVNLNELAMFGTKLADLSGGGTTARGVNRAYNYCDDWLTPAGERAGLFWTFAATADQVKESILNRLIHLRGLLESSSTEVNALCRYYDANEDGIVDSFEVVAARTADGNYTAWKPTAEYVPDRIVPNYGVQPEIVLVYPTNTEPIPDLVQYIFADHGLLGKGNIYPIIHKAIQLVWVDWCGNPTNPLDELLQGIVGDWDKVALSSEALFHLAEYHHELALHIETAVTSVRSSWFGNSSDAANAYFDTLCVALDEMAVALRSVSSDYNQVALGMWMEAQGIAGLIPSIIFTAQLIAATAAVGAATSATVIGGILGAIGVGAEAIAFVNMLMQVYGAWCSMINFIDVFVGACAGFTGAMRSIDTIQRVGGIDAPYDNPFV